MKQIIECVPNISEGRDVEKIKKISSVVNTIDGVNNYFNKFLQGCY